MNQKLSFQHKYVWKLFKVAQLILNRVSGLKKKKEIRKGPRHMTEILRNGRDLKTKSYLIGRRWERAQ